MPNDNARLTDAEIAEIERRCEKKFDARILTELYEDAARIIDEYQGVGGYEDGVWELKCSEYNLAEGLLQLRAEHRAVTAERDGLRELVDAVVVSEFTGITCRNAGGQNWFDRRDALAASRETCN